MATMMPCLMCSLSSVSRATRTGRATLSTPCVRFSMKNVVLTFAFELYRLPRCAAAKLITR